MCKKCSVEGYENKHSAKGYCNKHYLQMYRHKKMLERLKLDSNESKLNPNQIIEYDDHAEIVLCNKQGKEIARALIDLEDMDLVKDYRWHLNSCGYAYNYQVKLLHRFVINAPDDMVIDHINRNPLDNRKSNLRICTQQQNSMNRSVQSNNTSGYPGVDWKRKGNKWRARITVQKRQINLGSFDTFEEAVEARKAAEELYFGDFNRVDE